MRVAAKQRGDGNVASHLHHIGSQAFLAEKSLFPGDVKINGGNAAAWIGDHDFIQSRLRVTGRRQNDGQKNGEQQSERIAELSSVASMFVAARLDPQRGVQYMFVRRVN
jgi:hypothetical protein